MTRYPAAYTAAPDSSAVDAAAAAARRVVEALVRAGRCGEDVAGRLHAVADDIEAGSGPVDERIAAMWAGPDVPRHDPVTGPENPLAPPLRLTTLERDGVQGAVTLGMAYQGPPGHVHGGVSAMLLDHTLGVANLCAGRTGFTGELTLRYHRPAPMFEPLTVAARQVGVDGRKIRSEGAISTADGTVCVRASGLFVTPRELA
jgi:acyl-coenzyme A thioesterase PaaI-like protein